MKHQLFLLFYIFTVSLNAQTACDTIYGSPETHPHYGHDFLAFYTYFDKNIAPVLQECMKTEGTVISSLVVRFTLDCDGKILDVDFIRINAGEACKKRLREQFLVMGHWIPGLVCGEPVCSYAVWPIRCLKWE